MSMIVIRTQVYENYGAHDWDGEGACPQYWKAKGGHDYKVLNININADLQEIVDVASRDIVRFDDYFEEKIIDWSVENDDYLSDFEKSQLDYEGRIAFPEPTVDYADLVDMYAE